MEELNGVKLVVQRSRFFAHLYKLDSGDDINEILKVHRRKYKKANHHCYAILFDKNETAKDDGEVGHPGKVLLEILKKKRAEFSDVLIYADTDCRHGKVVEIEDLCRRSGFRSITVATNPIKDPSELP